MSTNRNALLANVPREIAEIGRPVMAKADLRKAEKAGDVGRAIERAMQLVGWSLKELAAKVDKDPRQVARWIAGAENPNVPALFAVPEFQQPFAAALAEQSGAELHLHITFQFQRKVG